MRSTGEGLFTLDLDGCASYMNQVARDLLGWPREELQGRELHPLRLDGSSLPIEECPMFHAGRDGKLVRVESDIFIRHDGSRLPVAYTASPFATVDGIEGCVVLFEDITERQATANRVEPDLEKLAWLERIQEALTEERLVLYSQPIIDLHTGEIVHCELLIRMRDAHEPGGTPRLISPDAFLPVAEEFGLITEIDRWVINRATEIAATGLAVEVNVSGRSIPAPGLVNHIRNAIQHTGADPKKIGFEITETALLSAEPVARAFVESLHALGCKVALDDFGTGYGGFTYLKQLPVDFIKIDVEFVLDVRTNSARRDVVQSIVSLAAGFGLKTVGEGVEDEAYLNLLRQLGVDYAQGFPHRTASPARNHAPTRTPRRSQMSTANADSRARRQHELDQEQTLVDLDQSIAEREQVLARRDQQHLDEAQVALDADRPAADENDHATAASVNPRQAELDLAQDRHDAHQTQLDHNQRALDLRQNLLDVEQAPLDHPADARPIIHEAPPAVAQTRDRALHRRAVAAVSRAE
jgi:PAS domain S-box-containing protein